MSKIKSDYISNKINQAQGPRQGNQHIGTKREEFIKDKSQGWRQEICDESIALLSRRGVKDFVDPQLEPLRSVVKGGANTKLNGKTKVKSGNNVK